jgi:hypothetical protein
MRREWLGDTFDHIKGSVIATCEESVARDIHVLPMVTDDPPWPTSDPAWDCYGWVVCRGPILILNKNMPFAFVRDTTLSLRQQYDRWLTIRQAYFANVKDFRGDLFLDPDTGIAFPDVEDAYSKGRPKKNDHAYIHRHELVEMTQGNERLLIVYQHKHQGNPLGYLEATKKRLEESGLHSFGYSLTHASMVFICRSTERLRQLQQHFENKLRGAPTRIK